MTPGEIYYHINTGKRMRIIKCDDPEVCTCEQIDEPKELNERTKEMEYIKAICAKANLFKTLQPNLFQE